jgi:dATP pyrophosphohydrolase
MIDAGETAYAAAYRECGEETGLRPARFFKSDFVETFYAETTDGVHLVPAFAAYVDGARTPVISEEHTDHAWCTLDDVLARFVWPSQRRAVRVIAEAVATWPEIGAELRDITQLVEG